MSDRASVRITIGGTLPREHLPVLAEIVADNDLRTEWDGAPFEIDALASDEPLELYGTEMPGGQVPKLDAFCCAHGLPFRRWSGGCLGAFLPEIVVFGGSGALREYTASEDEHVLFSLSWIKGFARLRDLKRALERAELAIPPFILL